MKKLSVLLSVFIFSSSFLTAQSDFPGFQLTRDFWTSQDFIKSFMGTYGFSDREPKVNQDEAAVIQEIIPLVERGREQEAINILQANTTAQSSAAFDFTLGNLYLQSGQNARAQRAYREAIRKMPDFKNAHKNLGSVFVQEGNFREAIPHLIRTIELGGNDGVLYGVLGYAYLNLEKFASAENAYRIALLMQPDSRDWKNGLIQSLNAQRKHAELIGVLEEVIEQHPRTADYWVFQANAFVALQDYQNAIANLEMVDRMGLSNARSLMLLGDLYLQEGIPGSALAAYEKSLARGGDLGTSEFIRAASILVSQGNFDEGARYINQIFERRRDRLTDRQRLELFNLRSEIYLATGEEEKAAQTLEDILGEDPLNGRALLSLAEYYWRKGDLEEASLMFERAQKIEEYEVQALVQNARMLVDQRKFREAVDLLRRVVLLDQSDRYRQYLEAVERAADVRGS